MRHAFCVHTHATLFGAHAVFCHMAVYPKSFKLLKLILPQPTLSLPNAWLYGLERGRGMLPHASSHGTSRDPLKHLGPLGATGHAAVAGHVAVSVVAPLGIENRQVGQNKTPKKIQKFDFTITGANKKQKKQAYQGVPPLDGCVKTVRVPVRLVCG